MVEVTLDLLLRELTGVIKWFEFGLELGLANDELKTIEIDYRFVYQCKTRVFGLWLEKKKGSWFEVVKALRGIKMEPLAQRIAGKYGEFHLLFNIGCCVIKKFFYIHNNYRDPLGSRSDGKL